MFELLSLSVIREKCGVLTARGGGSRPRPALHSRPELLQRDLPPSSLVRHCHLRHLSSHSPYHNVGIFCSPAPGSCSSWHWSSGTPPSWGTRPRPCPRWWRRSGPCPCPASSSPPRTDLLPSSRASPGRRTAVERIKLRRHSYYKYRVVFQVIIKSRVVIVRRPFIMRLLKR